MSKYFCLVLWLMLLPVYANASQPEGGFQPDVKVSGKPLTILWGGPESKPKVVAWMQSYKMAEPRYVLKNENKVVLPRNGINKIPSTLLIVPENDRLKPVVLDVGEDTQEIQFIPEAIPKNEVWFWGFTPENPCSYQNGPSALSITARLIHKTNIYSSFHGAFVWNISLKQEDKFEIPFYFISGDLRSLKEVSIQGFNKANDISQSFCHIHHGGKCDFAFETNKDVWGRSHQIIFKAYTSSEINNCPI